MYSLKVIHFFNINMFLWVFYIKATPLLSSESHLLFFAGEKIETDLFYETITAPLNISSRVKSTNKFIKQAEQQFPRNAWPVSAMGDWSAWEE